MATNTQSSPSRVAPLKEPQTLCFSVFNQIAAHLRTLSNLLEGMAGQTGLHEESCIPKALDSGVRAFLWDPHTKSLEPVPEVDLVELSLLKGVEHQVETVLQNTRQFADGFSANNVLLWGARGTGKSSCVKAVHKLVNDERPERALVLAQIHRSDLSDLPHLLELLGSTPHRFLLFCDDLVFDDSENDYRFLKVVLDGGVRGRPKNVLFYATSNRRHLVSREAVENEQSTALMPHESVEEKVALSDRFGLWIGFHSLTERVFEEVVCAYAHHYNLPLAQEDILRRAREWSRTRGGRSGRVAWQFIQALAGELKVVLD